MISRKWPADLMSITEHFKSASNISSLGKILEKLIQNYGNYYTASGYFKPFEFRAENIISVNYPDNWITHYSDRDYIRIDPTIHGIKNSLTAIEWKNFQRLDSRQKAIFNEIRDIGVKAGTTIPIHLPHNRAFIVSFASLEKDTEWQKPFMKFIATSMFERYVALTQVDESMPVRLSPREQECLTWVTSGKSSWDIGMILGISENTVNFHLKNAFYKLGGKGRIICVVKAIMLGLISP